jgi:hypothetical protein
MIRFENRKSISSWMAIFMLTVPASPAATVVLPVEVISALPAGTIPMDVDVDFADIIARAKQPGVFDPNTVEVINLTTGVRESHALSPHVEYGDRARVRWLVKNSAEKRFEIRFETSAQRSVLRPRADTPLIGVGDLLRYSGPEPRAIASSLLTRLADLNGDGVRDLIATDYYTNEPTHGFDASAALRLQVDMVPGDLQVLLNGRILQRVSSRDGWLEFGLESKAVKLGVNHITIRRGDCAADDTLLKDRQLPISYRRKGS